MTPPNATELSADTAQVPEPERQPKLVVSSENLRPVSFYANSLRAGLSARVFQTRPSRLLWFAGFLMIAAGSLYLIAHVQPIWPIKLGLGIVVGTCYGGLGFLSHEILHGSVVRNRRAQDALAFVCYIPFFVSPTFWRCWHNQLHHGNTQSIVDDPDAFPTLRIFKHSRFMKFMFPFTPGSGYKRSFFYFLFWFSFHVFVAQIYLRFRNSVYDRLNHRRVTLEMGGQILIYGSLLYFLGPSNLVWTLAVPFVVQNYFVMSYVATNHNLSPLTKINDPLVNSLTVTNHRWLEVLHLNFGYHVGHHIFPTVSGAYALEIHELLLKQYPGEYHTMTKFRAMSGLYRTARIYKGMKTLINPLTQQTYPTIHRT